MMLIAGTVPVKGLPLTMGKVGSEGEFLVVDGHPVPCTQGTGAMIKAALVTTEYLKLEPPQVLVAGDTGQGNGSREIYEYLIQKVAEISPEVLALHYCLPDMALTRRLCESVRGCAKRPMMIADAGSMYAAKAAGLALEFDIFTPDATEMAFLADPEATHPAYIARHLFDTDISQTPKLVAAAYEHKDAAKLLLELGDPSEAYLLKHQEALSEVVPNDSLLKMFYAERVYQLQIGRNYFPEKIASELLPDSVPNLPERIKMSSTFWGRFRIRRKSINFLRDLDSLILTSRHPWPEPLDAFDNTIRSADQTSKIIPVGKSFILRYAEILVHVRSILLAAMIERYRGSHEGQLPESLDVLVPTYSEAIPSDPFTKNNLLYKHDEKGYIVYSAFVNRKDDNGSINMKTKGEIPLDLGYRIGVRLQKK